MDAGEVGEAEALHPLSLPIASSPEASRDVDNEEANGSKEPAGAMSERRSDDASRKFALDDEESSSGGDTRPSLLHGAVRNKRLSTLVELPRRVQGRRPAAHKALYESQELREAQKSLNNAMSDASDEEISFNIDPAAARVCNSLFLATGVAPLLFVIAIGMQCWMEKRSVCEHRPFIQAKKKVVSVGCDDSELESLKDGTLVMVRCKIRSEGQESSSGLLGGTELEEQFGNMYHGVGMSVTTEIYQCVVIASRHTRRDAWDKEEGDDLLAMKQVVGQWSSKILPGQGGKDLCDMEPLTEWPSGFPESARKLATSAKVGPFTVGEAYLNLLPLDSRVRDIAIALAKQRGLGQVVDDSIPGWIYVPPTEAKGSLGWLYKGEEGVNRHPTYGAKRMRITTYNWDVADSGTLDGRMVTLVGEFNKETSRVEPWDVPTSTMCKDVVTIQPLMVGDHEDILDVEWAEAVGRKSWVVRFAGFLLSWFALILALSPIEIVADCIPCFSEYGDAITRLTACLSCPLALLINLLLALILWCSVNLGALIVAFVFSFLVLCCCTWCCCTPCKKTKREEQISVSGAPMP